MSRGARDIVLHQPELLTLILAHLRAQATLSDVAHCFPVSKLWYTISLERLYSNVVLDRLSAFDFFKYKENERHWHFIRSLSVTFKRGTCSEPSAKEIPEEEFTRLKTPIPTGRRERTNERVRDLARAVQQMPRLRSFSIRRHAAGSNMHEEGFTFSQTMLKNIIENLPESCVHVEIDTAGDDHGDSLEQKYLTQAISRLLPRLHSLRLVLSISMSGSYYSVFQADGTRQPFSAPHLKSLVIWFYAAIGMNNDPEYETLANVLERFAAANPQLEHGKLLSFIHSPTTPDMSVPGVRWCQHTDAYYFHDIITKTSVGYPAPPVAWARVMLRRAKGEELICDSSAAGEVAENRMWLSSLQGDRLPATISLAERGLIKSELLCLNSPRTGARGEGEEDIKCDLLTDEAAAGRLLLEPKQRADHVRPFMYWKAPYE